MTNCTDTTYRSTVTAAEIAERIRSSGRIAVVSHTKVDGDALGSMLAIKRAIEPLGKLVDIYVMGPLEPNLMSLAGDTPYRRVEEQPPSDDYDLILIVDTGAWSQLEQVQEWLRRNHHRLVIIDHHARGDADIAPARFVDPSRASASQLVMDVLDELGVRLSGGEAGVAEALFIGLATDTGWFRYDNAQQEVFAAAARLLEKGVDKSRLYQVIEETQRPHRLALESRALASLTYARHGAIAVMSLSPQDFEETGATIEDLTGLVNAPLIVGDVRASILLAQSEPGITKISFRSKPAPPGATDDFINVNVLAQRFGGGGHIHAAGARLKTDLQAARQAVLRELETL